MGPTCFISTLVSTREDHQDLHTRDPRFKPLSRLHFFPKTTTETLVSSHKPGFLPTCTAGYYIRPLSFCRVLSIDNRVKRIVPIFSFLDYFCDVLNSCKPISNLRLQFTTKFKCPKQYLFSEIRDIKMQMLITEYSRNVKQCLTMWTDIIQNEEIETFRIYVRKLASADMWKYETWHETTATKTTSVHTAGRMSTT